MEHGDFMFSAASTGVLGGLYPGAVSIAGCLAGFQVTPNGAQSNIQALVHGVSSGHTDWYNRGSSLFSDYPFVLAGNLSQTREIFHSSIHPAGSGIGGAQRIRCHGGNHGNQRCKDPSHGIEVLQ